MLIRFSLFIFIYTFISRLTAYISIRLSTSSLSDSSKLAILKVLFCKCVAVFGADKFLQNTAVGLCTSTAISSRDLDADDKACCSLSAEGWMEPTDADESIPARASS